MSAEESQKDHSGENEHERGPQRPERGSQHGHGPQRGRGSQHGHGPQHAGDGHHHHKPMTPDDAVSSLLVLGQVALNAGDYESAVEAYASTLKLEANEVALYNLASLRARGLGIPQDYVEAARLFRQAELLGNERARMMCAKCMFDYVVDGIDVKTPANLYASMAVFVSRVYPEADNPRLEATHGLTAIANTLLAKGENVEAEKALRAATEFGSTEGA